MIGNASTFAASTHREPLIPTAWSASSITAYFNQGSFANGSPVYLFVVDSTGAVSSGKAITISGTYVDGVAPITDTNIPAKNSTGWPVASKTLSYYTRDSSNITRTTLGLSINGGTVMTCADNLVCTPTGSTATSYKVEYTRPTNWADNTTYTLVATARDVYNNQMTETWTFTTELAAPAALNITTTSPIDNGVLGTPYSFKLTATGGVTPYTWDNTTALPAGLSVSTNTGNVYGVPQTAGGPTSVTYRATDAVGTVDTQALDITINTATYPAGEIHTVADTYLKSGGSTTQNFSTGDKIIIYTWPANTVTHRGLMKWDLSSVAGTVPTSAQMRLYMTDYGMGGGDNTYVLTVHRVTGVNPTVSSASWSYYDGLNPWTNGADGGGGDIGASEASASIDKTPRYYLIDITAMVQDWIEEPSSNKGLIINPPSVAVEDSNRYFASFEYPIEAYRPVLFLSYVPAPTTITLSGGVLEGGIIE